MPVDPMVKVHGPPVSPAVLTTLTFIPTRLPEVVKVIDLFAVKDVANRTTDGETSGDHVRSTSP